MMTGAPPVEIRVASAPNSCIAGEANAACNSSIELNGNENIR